MKRRDVLKGIMLVLPVILTVLLLGCERHPDPLYPSPATSFSEGAMIGIDGGVVTAMDGDVVITIPAGAVTEPAMFIVHELRTKSGRLYALKSIVIEPLIAFKEPVQLTIKYDGCLGTGVDLCEAGSVSFLVWNSEADYSENSTPLFCTCCNVNRELHTVCNCIPRTGVVAVLAEW